MKNSLKVSFILFAALVTRASWATCELTFQTEQFFSKGQFYILELDLTAATEAKIFEHSIPANGMVEQMQHTMSQLVDVDPFALLRKQKALFDRHFSNFSPLYANIINQKVGEIRPIDCLVSTLLEKHFQIQEGFEIPTEFGAWVLQSETKKKLKIYFESIGKASVPNNRELVSKMEKDFTSDFQVLAHLHNHPFVLDNPTGDIAGTLIPSGTRDFGDIFVYLRSIKKWDLQQAWITNGFDTVKFDQGEFERIASLTD